MHILSSELHIPALTRRPQPVRTSHNAQPPRQRSPGRHTLRSPFDWRHHFHVEQGMSIRMAVHTAVARQYSQ